MATFKEYTTKNTVPELEQTPITLSTSGRAVVLADDTQELQVGAYLVDLNTLAIRKIVFKRDALNYRIDKPFTTDIPLSPVNWISQTASKVKMISIAADKGGDVTVDGVTLSAGSSISQTLPESVRGSGSRYLHPMIVDGSTNPATVMTE